MTDVLPATGDETASGDAGAAQPTADRSAAIRQSLYNAIVDRRLLPGTKLVEDEVGATFGASRTVVRAALQALAFDGVVTIARNRGAFVAKPTPEDARQVFAARRLLEPGLAAGAAALATATDIAALDQHLALEADAVAARGPSARRAEIKASGDLHLRIAGMVGNDHLLRFLKELVARSSLVIALYGRTGASSCALAERRQIVDALRTRDGDRAALLMQRHIDHIEADFDYGALDGVSLRDALSD